MKLSINHIRRGIPGANGTWSTTLVSEFGRKTADKVELRVNETMADKIERALKAARELNKVLTVECDEFPEAEVKGVAGVRTEEFTTKAGEAVAQTALYLKLGANPTFKVEDSPTSGNIDALIAELGVEVDNLPEEDDF